MGLINREISPEIVSQAASRLGEERDRTRSALSASVPSVLTVLSDVASTETGGTHLKHVIDDSRRDGRSAEALLASSDHNGVGALIDEELGERSATLTDAVARSSGVKPESAHQLLGGVASIAFMALRKNAPAMGSDTLKTMFREQRPDWIRKLPAPLASLFTAGTASAAASEQPRQAVAAGVIEGERVVRGPAIRRVEGPRRSWLLPVVLLAALALIGIPLLRSMGHRPRIAQLPARPFPQQILPRTETVPLTLPNSETLSVARGSAAYQLATYMAGPVPTPQQFTLSPMNFEFGTTTLTPDSLPTVNDIGAILRAYPSATVRVESHTDSIGTPESNLALSVSRSEAVKGMLANRAVDPKRIETAGLGQEDPIADNDTEAGRAKNRRTDIVVTGR
jgi:outer membrane protein OmpA-like peptidoglycan-associated protein